MVLDASVIIAFLTEMDDGPFLRSLTDLGIELLVTGGVVAEVKKEPGVSRLQKAISDGWISIEAISSSQFKDFKSKFPMLDYAEIEVLLVGLALKQSGEDYCCVLDEGPGRRIADALELEKTGTIGLLNMLSDRQIIDKNMKEKLLCRLGQSTFRLKEQHVSANQ
jgi:predicted nucleic acid-binding protein